MNILILVGSLRNGSWTRHLADGLEDLLPEGASAQVYDGIADLPHYDQDRDGPEASAAVADFRSAVAGADALVLVTPEYNGSVPGVLKNAVDWASRPRGAAAIDGKPAAVVSVSPSPRGAQWAREDLTRILRVAGASPVGEGLGVAAVHEVLSEGRIADPAVRRSLEGLVERLLEAEDSRAA